MTKQLQFKTIKGKMCIRDSLSDFQRIVFSAYSAPIKRRETAVNLPESKPRINVNGDDVLNTMPDIVFFIVKQKPRAMRVVAIKL